MFSSEIPGSQSAGKMAKTKFIDEKFVSRFNYTMRSQESKILGLINPMLVVTVCSVRADVSFSV